MPTRQRITFPSQDGAQLAAALELPDRPPRAFVLFAHCFTCGKDIAAAARIARTLAANGFAVLRFDFTGLGGSEGDFANTNFSSNVADLLAAAAWLRSEHEAPQILVGHSLGGTAVLMAAPDIPEARAVVTIAAPASPEHVVKQFADDVAEIRDKGEAVVDLAGREFRIRRQFLDDVRDQPLTDSLGGLKRALLVFHAPFDATVPIEQATRLFSAAKHPKSFISLDGADHLVSDVADAQYVANSIAAWVVRYLSDPEPSSKSNPEPDAKVEVPAGQVVVGEGNKRFLRDVASDDHAWTADEPKRVGGDNLGPDPYEHLLAALGTCTSMTVRMYANRKNWPLEEIEVILAHTREHAQDCEDCIDKPVQVDVLSQTVRLEGELDTSQRARLMEIADRCPVHKTLEKALRIDTSEST